MTTRSWGVAPGYGGKRPSANHGRRPEAQLRGLRFGACSPPRMNDPAGTSLGSLGRATSLSADPLSHFRNRKKACPARGQCGGITAASNGDGRPSATARTMCCRDNRAAIAPRGLVGLSCRRSVTRDVRLTIVLAQRAEDSAGKAACFPGLSPSVGSFPIAFPESTKRACPRA
jgi:hypothetical protein